MPRCINNQNKMFPFDVKISIFKGLLFCFLCKFLFAKKNIPNGKKFTKKKEIRFSLTWIFIPKTRRTLEIPFGVREERKSIFKPELTKRSSDREKADQKFKISELRKKSLEIMNSASHL